MSLRRVRETYSKFSMRELINYNKLILINLCLGLILRLGLMDSAFLACGSGPTY